MRFSIQDMSVLTGHICHVQHVRELNFRRRFRMATKEDVLEKETYKQGSLDVGSRVFYTLIGEQGNPYREKLNTHRNSKAIGLLFQKLYDKHHITERELDEILLDVIS
jgi:hypothetical protein